VAIVPEVGLLPPGGDKGGEELPLLFFGKVESPPVAIVPEVGLLPVLVVWEVEPLPVLVVPEVGLLPSYSFALRTAMVTLCSPLLSGHISSAPGTSVKCWSIAAASAPSVTNATFMAIRLRGAGRGRRFGVQGGEDTMDTRRGR